MWPFKRLAVVFVPLAIICAVVAAVLLAVGAAGVPQSFAGDFYQHRGVSCVIEDTTIAENAFAVDAGKFWAVAGVRLPGESADVLFAAVQQEVCADDDRAVLHATADEARSAFQQRLADRRNDSSVVCGLPPSDDGKQVALTTFDDLQSKTGAPASSIGSPNPKTNTGPHCQHSTAPQTPFPNAVVVFFDQECAERQHNTQARLFLFAFLFAVATAIALTVLGIVFVLLRRRERTTQAKHVDVDGDGDVVALDDR